MPDAAAGHSSANRPVKRLVVLGLVAAVLAGCDDEIGVSRAPASLVVEPLEIDFEDVAVGLDRTRELLLQNPGSASVDLTAVTLAETLGPEFVLADVPEMVEAGGERIMKVTFAPSAPGARQGELTFDTDSTETPTVVVPIRGRGVEPALVADPPLVDFGRVVLGTTRTASVTLTNTSDREVEVIRTEPDASTSIELTAELVREKLAPGASLSMTVRYTPSDLGLDEGRFTVLDNSPRVEALSVRVRGTGVESDIEIEPTMLTFSGLTVGQSQVLSFFIRNIGDRAHEISVIRFESTTASVAGELSLPAAARPATPFMLDPQQTQQVDVRYLPENTTPDVDRVMVESTGLARPGFVQISASAELAPRPRIEVTPAFLAFGQVEIGQGKPLNLRITSAGTADLVLTASVTIDPLSAPYSLAGQPPDGQVLPPTDSEEFQVILSPTQLGPVPNADVVIASNDPNLPEVRVPLTGQGIDTSIPSIFVDPNPLAFGLVPRGVNASRTVLVRNDGTAPLQIQMVRLNNDAGGRFTLPSPPLPSTMLAPMQQLSFGVEYFDNGVVMTYNGVLEIQSNDPSQPVIMVPITASTEPPPPALTDIAVTLTWSRTGADVDLHVIRPGGTFFERPSDCCYCNPNPEWGVVGQPQDNPFLDRDDLVGPGPEKFNLSEAETGEYQVVAHFFSDTQNSPVDVTLEVSVRGTVVATRTDTMSANERWVAGFVDFNATTNTGTWRNGPLGPFFTIFNICR